MRYLILMPALFVGACGASTCYEEDISVLPQLHYEGPILG
jgi:hypothetical protein